MVALHAALLAGCFIEPIALHRTFIPALGWPMFALVIAANALRWWCIAALGPRWSARVIVMPGAPLVRTGPYRYLESPELPSGDRRGSSPAADGIGLDHSGHVHRANLALLTVRIRCETRALAAAVPAEAAAAR